MLDRRYKPSLDSSRPHQRLISGRATSVSIMRLHLINNYLYINIRIYNIFNKPKTSILFSIILLFISINNVSRLSDARSKSFLDNITTEDVELELCNVCSVFQVNFLFSINIMRILLSKLRSVHTHEAMQSRYKTGFF